MPRGPDFGEVPESGHVCWVVEDDETYLRGAEVLLRRAKARGDKAVVFGPQDSPALTSLRPLADAAADPRLQVLDGGPLRPETMLDMFATELAAARRAGHAGLAVVADMDWLLPLAPTAQEIVGFELLLDRRSIDLGITVVCAYRTASFDTSTIVGTRCVHPFEAGTGSAPPFRLLAADPGTWRLSGDVDIAVVDPFSAALEAAVGSGAASTCVVDVSDLEFIDARGLQVIAHLSALGDIQLVGARGIVRRSWAVGRFAHAAPRVEVTT